MNRLVVNFKTYPQATGRNAIELGEKISSVSEGTVLIPQFTELKEVAELDNPVYAQHIDAVSPGSHTGSILPEALKEAGCEGTLINHSERTLDLDQIEERIKVCREKGMESMVCVPSIEREKKVVDLEPDAIAIEPPELIGSDNSVSTARPELIEKAVEAGRGIEVLCGAGVSDGKDVRKAIDLGAKGVLVASAIVKNDHPKKIVKEMTEEL